MSICLYLANASKTFFPLTVACVNAGKMSGEGTNLKPDGSVRYDRISARSGATVKATKPRQSVWDCSVLTKNLGHPAAFPEQLANDHIISWSNEGDIVYDPFMGSGTTAKMAILNNRKWIGSEMSDEYCGIIERRIENCT